jgi:hypothetical protein
MLYNKKYTKIQYFILKAGKDIREGSAIDSDCPCPNNNKELLCI